MSILRYTRSTAQWALTKSRHIGRLSSVMPLCVIALLVTFGNGWSASTSVPLSAQHTHLVSVASTIAPSDLCGAVLAGC
jgi:hypothetical protein